MSIFTDDPADRADWPLLRNGSINLFHDVNELDGTIAELERLNYRVVRVRFATADQFWADLGSALKWREQFGYEPFAGNLDALHDGLRGEPFRSAVRSVLCIEHFSALVAVDRARAIALLDLIETASRDYLLFGRVLIGLVHSDDRDFACHDLGSRSAHWHKTRSL